MTGLLTAADLAEHLGIAETQVLRRSRVDNWPHVRIGHKTIRYRPEHVEQIVALYERRSDGSEKPQEGLPGQTARSKARAS
jgi:hypothetical protein